MGRFQLSALAAMREASSGLRVRANPCGWTFSMRRIVILGCAGSGKSALARMLGEVTGLPVVCLDSIWQPHWTKDDVPRFRKLIADAHADDGWISDGNFAVATFDLRLPRADLVVWLERPRLGCAWRAIRRVFRQGEAHRFRNLNRVLAFIWNFDRVNRPLIEETRAEHGPSVPVMRLRNDDEIAEFVRSARVLATGSG